VAPFPDFKNIVETLTCPVHKRRPEILLNDDNSIKLTCCCVDFNKECYYILKKLTAGQAIETAVAQWKKDNQ